MCIRDRRLSGAGGLPQPQAEAVPQSSPGRAPTRKGKCKCPVPEILAGKSSVFQQSSFPLAAKAVHQKAVCSRQAHRSACRCWSIWLPMLCRFAKGSPLPVIRRRSSTIESNRPPRSNPYQKSQGCRPFCPSCGRNGGAGAKKKSTAR